MGSDSEMKPLAAPDDHLCDDPRSPTSPPPLIISAVPPTMDNLERRYAAFVRRDAYGTMGRGALPFSEMFRLSFALLVLFPLRLAMGILVVVVYYIICRICTLFSSPEDVSGWIRAVLVRSGRFLSRAMLFVMGFYWIPVTRREKLRMTDSEECERPGAIISNHVSYVDILYHMSSSFPSFVAKRSVSGLPLVGIISKCLGCIYVQRESKSSDSKGVSAIVMDRIQKAHQEKLCPMMIFPEGTTTNGDFLLPFKSGAFLATVPVLPVILKYPYKRFSPAWDSISGIRHMVLLLCQFQNHLEVVQLPVYCPSQQEKDDPKLYANNVRKLMALEGNLALSEVGLAEKRVYHDALNGNGLPRDLHQKDD